MRAKEHELGELHVMLANILKEQINLKDENGRVNSATLNVARQFLKDSGIEASKEAPHLKELTLNLPSFEGEPAFLQ
jgi:hypothetical protein